MKQEFLEDLAGDFQHQIIENNIEVVPSSAIITVFEPNTTNELVTAQAMNIGSDGLLTYSLTAGDNDIHEENYKADITYIDGGVTKKVVVFYDVVKVLLHQVITDEDVINELPSTDNLQWQTLGDMTGGSTTTIIDLNLSTFEDDNYTGGVATNLTNNETRKITDFVANTGTITTETFTTTNESGDKYKLQRSFGREITRAWEKLLNLIRENGKRHALILDSNDLREVHILMSVVEITKGFSNESDEFWFAVWNKYEEKADIRFNKLNLKYDIGDDGTLSSSDKVVTNRRQTKRG